MMQERNIEERAKFHFYLARMYAKTGRNEFAIQYLRKALEEGFNEKTENGRSARVHAVARFA